MSDAYLAMPKVELHVHLEGAMRPETLLRLARRNGIDLPVSSEKDFARWYRFVDFPHFVEVYLTLSGAIRTPDDLHDLTRDFLLEQARQNVLHTEATYTAQTIHASTGMGFADQMAAIRAAADAVRDSHGTTLRLIVDIPRNLSTPEQSARTAHWVADAHGDGLVAALGLGGYEVGFPPEDFAQAFAIAREAGVPAVIHAGETEGPASIRGALDALHAVRIGHGIACLRDPALVDRLRDSQTMLEVCPSSNVCLGVVPDIAAHPLPRMVAAGLNVCIGSDDPPLFDTTLNDEYALVADTLGLGADFLRAQNRAAAHASLLSGDERRDLVRRLDAA
ncbi:adenosine deaminase [Oceaniovalibus guishaninsula JLT2003]|uniref:Adenosine deaminase n=1 Tax=Oceaniovalibus guishaninsula JLT2003 TaxID=1231392 RepID=K2GK25_9RHOB|nr:adenosine deaminase [Oceaniovalibus guishaninsula]EKE43101.1 adenosine deaminase [Oceaniovalibus guishaninsula JLT2003]